MNDDYYKTKSVEYYKEACKLNLSINSDLKQALKTNERVPIFIDNMAKQFSLIQKMRLKKGKPLLDDFKLKKLVYDLTDVFLISIQKETEKRIESDVQKKLKEQKLQAQKDLEETVNGNISGDFKEFLTTEK